MWQVLKGQKLAFVIVGILLLELPFKFMYWPGADALGLVSTPLLIIHQFRFFFFSNNHLNWLVKTVGFTAFLGLWVGLTVLLKKFLPTTLSLNIISIFSAGVLFYIALVTFGKQKLKYRRLDLLLHVFIVLSLIKVITRQNEINYYQAINETAYFEVLSELESYQRSNDSLLRYIKSQNPDPVQSVYIDIESTNELISHIAYTKQLLAEQLTHDFFTDPDSLMKKPEFAANRTIPTKLFVLKSSENPQVSLKDYQVDELKAKLVEWRKSRIYKFNQLNSFLESSLLNCEAFTYNYPNGTRDTLNWEESLFYRIPSIGFMGNLNRIILDLEMVKSIQLLHFNSNDEDLFEYVFSTNYSNYSREIYLEKLVNKANKSNAFTAQSYLILWGVLLYFMILLGVVKRLPAIWIKGGIFLFFILLFELFFLEIEPLLSYYYPNNLVPIYTINFILATSLVPVHHFFQELFLTSFQKDELNKL